MLSVIIPSHQDPFLQKTIDSLLENAQGKIEVIVVLDGYVPKTPIKPDPRVKVIKFPNNRGMRAAINAGLKAARGKYVMKCDSHCLFGPGYDKIMSENCAKHWLMIPRRYTLDAARWQIDKNRPARDYHYIAFPKESREYGLSMSNQDWQGRGTGRHKHDIDDTMSFQGSCWFANRNYFMKRVGLLDDSNKAYGPFGGEQLEVGLKYWLGGGEIKVIKKTWYAHLGKRPYHYRDGLFTRKYKINSNTIRSRTWTAKHWLENEEPNMLHPFSWLVEKFWPVPTWPEDRNLWVLPKKKRTWQQI